MNLIKRQKLKKLRTLLFDALIQSPTSASLDIVDNDIILNAVGVVNTIIIRYDGYIGISNSLPPGYSIKLNKNIIKIRNINYWGLHNDGLLFSAIGDFEIRSCHIRCFNGNKFYATVTDVDKDQLIGRSDTKLEDDTLTIEPDFVSEKTPPFKSYIDDDTVLGLYTSRPIFEGSYTGYYNYSPKNKVYLTGKVPTSDSLPLYQNKIHKTSKRYQEKINTVLRNLTANSPSKRMIEVGDQPIDKKRISKIQKRAEKIISQIKAKSSPRTTMTKVERKGY